MAVAIAWLPGPAGTRRRGAKPSVEEPDAAEPARPDLWGARVSNDPGLPDRCLRLTEASTSRRADAVGGPLSWWRLLVRQLVCLQAKVNTVSVIQRLKLSLSMNCLNSSASSLMSAVMTRVSALPCSMRALS